MTALHKPERATYGQAVEAQHPEYNYVHVHNQVTWLSALTRLGSLDMLHLRTSFCGPWLTLV